MNFELICFNKAQFEEVSILDIVSSKTCAAKSICFELKLKNKEKRMFEITAETVILDKKDCIMLLLHEQTVHY